MAKNIIQSFLHNLQRIQQYVENVVIIFMEEKNKSN